MARRYLPKSVEELAEWYMRYVSPLSLIGGFLADNLFLLRRVDLWTSNVLLFSYLAVAALCIILYNLIESGRLRSAFFLKVVPLVPVVAQFAFGGLFSAYLSLYSRSAALPVSWIFVVGIAALLIGNERFVKLYRRFSFQIAMYFTVLYSFLIFFLPVLFNEIGPFMFFAAGLCALVALSVFVRIIFILIPERVSERTALARAVAIIFIVFNALYFLNAIPPLPLALKDAGVYHSIERTPSEYVLTYEPLPWYEQFLPYNTVFHKAPGEPVYVWSAVFAPTGLTTTIFHEWQHYDDAQNEWVTEQMIQFSILGGRDGGYRGYSARPNPEAGAWRVNVITQYGQIIGRISFTIALVASPVPLITSTQ
jgi:hypothetical protein